jgi:carbonic anhydrase
LYPHSCQGLGVLPADPWWVNIAVVIPFVTFWWGRKRGLDLHRRELAWLAFWAVSFGAVEAAIVIYLRGIYTVTLGYPASLKAIADLSARLAPAPVWPLPTDLLRLEAQRELATMVMLVAVAAVYSRNWVGRIAAFLFAFAIWDAIYYFWLWVWIRWPGSLSTVDVLFLIPRPWIAPVWFPIGVSSATVLAILAARRLRSRVPKDDSGRALDIEMPTSPEAALRELVEGNRRFATNQLTSIQHDLDALKNHTVDRQEPFAAVLACADSRLPVELIFDQTIGHLFVTRLAGNVVTPEVIGSLEYGVAILGVKAVLVLGHTSCGAVTAAVRSDPAPGHIASLLAPLQRAVQESRGDLTTAIALNTRIQAAQLIATSTIIREAVEAGKVTVVSGVYDLGTGIVSMT